MGALVALCCGGLRQRSVFGLVVMVNGGEKVIAVGAMGR